MSQKNPRLTLVWVRPIHSADPVLDQLYYDVRRSTVEVDQANRRVAYLLQRQTPGLGDSP